MELALEANDLAALDEAQQDAVLRSLFIALVADGEPSPEEVAQFEQTIAALPWRKDRAQLQAETAATMKRLAQSDDAGKRALLMSIAAATPPALREKIVLDMAAIVAADRVATTVERNTIGVFCQIFELDPQATIDKIKARIPASDVAAELGLKLQPADIAALDDDGKLAVLEALACGVLADGQASPVELRVFDALVKDLPWGMEPAVLEATLEGVGRRIATLANPADFLVGLAKRLPDQALREKVFCAIATIVVAEGAVNQREQQALAAFVLAFSISSERVAEVRRAVSGRSTPAPAPSTTAN